ncbi:hypothetical protein [Pseudomonas fulva]|uniref:hypothetical protein n=1 Tax=Pseudomonas fulva TaxID=47880 RepID=UPI0018AC1283|nr:hypothetical protein [Pseudomonas fulva]MBF8692380.1 hypothetical protein [Pseudomonas fulva]
MNFDKQEIKALALACDPAKCADEAEEDRRLAEFHSELTPEAVLALLAENDMIAAQRLMHVRLNLSLRARRKVWVAACEKAEDELLDALAERGQLKAENQALRSALGDCADELSAEIICKHGGQKPEEMHPVTRRLYERDMAAVTEARAALAKAVSHD